MNKGLALLWLLTACEASEPIPEPAAPAAQTETWQLIGRVTPNETPWPDAPPFEGGRALITQCGSLRPCAAERWRSEAGATMDLVRVRDQIHHADGTIWAGRWWSIRGVLRACLGDPLSVPPTRDPGAFRSLLTGPDGPRWMIRLSGNNPCGLSGFVSLNAKKDRLDLSRLTCDDKPWVRGGRDCARERQQRASASVSE